MTDPKDVAHDKKVQQQKKHHGEKLAPGAAATPQPGKKPALNKEPGAAETYQQHLKHEKRAPEATDEKDEAVSE